MKEEKISIRKKEVSVKIQGSIINSIRVKDIEKKAIRVYDNNVIGVSGGMGKISDKSLKDQAIINLNINIPYPYKLSGPMKDHRNYSKTAYTETDVVSITEEILNVLNKKFSDFLFSESVKLIDVDQKMSNSIGLDLRYLDQQLSIGLIVKATSSPHLFDTVLSWRGREFDEDRFISFNSELLEAERKVVEMPKKGKLPVFMLMEGALNVFLQRHLNGEIYGNGSSFFDKKMGKKVFNEKITIEQVNDSSISGLPFFDVEGVVKTENPALIEAGVISKVFTNKKIASKFNFDHTGSASGSYDDVPSLSGTTLRFKTNSQDIESSLNGEIGVLVIVASGGEFNADGNYATPVQAAYLFDGKKIIGKCPNFNMSNNIYEMLGKDYIGSFESKDLYFGDYVNLQGFLMNIKE